MRAVVFGAVAFAEPILDVLSSALDIAAVVGVSDDYREQSGMDPSYFADLEAWAARHGIAYSDGIPLDVDADWLIALGYPHMIPASHIAEYRRGAIGTHASLLPERRGGAPLNWAIIDGLTETGVSIMYLASEVDAGPLVWQSRIPIAADDDAAYVLRSAERALVRGFREITPKLLSGHLWANEQNPAGASYTRRREPTDGIIDWNQTSAQIHNLVRALASPFPGAFTFSNNVRVRITKTRRVYGLKPLPGPPGTVHSLPEGVFVVTGDYLLRIIEAEGLDADTRLLGPSR